MKNRVIGSPLNRQNKNAAKKRIRARRWFCIVGAA
jgi:hypothetical protein